MVKEKNQEYFRANEMNFCFLPLVRVARSLLEPYTCSTSGGVGVKQKISTKDVG